MFLTKRHLLATLTLAIATATAGVTSAQDQLKLAAGQRGNWDTSGPEIGSRPGIFKKHDLSLQMLYTQGGGETGQGMLSNSVDIGVAGGIMGALSAFSKGAPMTGAGVVDLIITDLCVMSCDKANDGGLTLIELAPGVTLDEVRARTGDSLAVSPALGEIAA